MTSKTQILFFLFVISFPFFVRAQTTSDDLSLISKHIREYDQKKANTHSVHMQRSASPVKSFLYLSLYLYQKILSEQISAGCEFDRSCSNYSIAAIREFGFAKGICLTADRLTRCNGQAQVETQNYLINHANGKTIDEPWMYRFKD